MTKPRLKMSESQWRDWDWKCLSLNDETETRVLWVSMTRPRLKFSESQCRDQDLESMSLNGDTETETNHNLS